MMVRLAVIMILAIGLSHGIRIDMLDKMVDTVDFNNPAEIEALDKVKILYFKSICYICFVFHCWVQGSTDGGLF